MCVFLMQNLGHSPSNVCIMFLASCCMIPPSILSRNVSFFKASLHTLYLIFNNMFALLIIYRDLPPIVENPSLARWSLCGVLFPMYSNSRLNLHAFLLSCLSGFFLTHIITPNKIYRVEILFPFFESLACWFNHTILGVVEIWIILYL